MKRKLEGRYETESTVGEKARAFASAPQLSVPPFSGPMSMAVPSCCVSIIIRPPLSNQRSRLRKKFNQFS